MKWGAFMKKKLWAVLAGIACGMLVINAVQIHNLEREVDNLRRELIIQADQTNQIVYGISGDIHSILEEEANQLALSEWEYGKLDVASRSAEILCTVVPKVFNPDTTKASILCNGQEYPMTYGNGQYTAALTLSIFETSEVTAVKMEDGGTVRTQELNWTFEPRYEALMSASASVHGSSTNQHGEGSSIWSANYGITVHVERKGQFRVQSVELVEMLDGKEIGRLPVDLSYEGQAAYAESLSTKNSQIAIPEPQNTTEDGSIYNGSTSFLYPLKKSYQVPNGSVLELYVDVVDGDGLRYRTFVEGVALTESGQPDESRMDEMFIYTNSEPVMIFDAAGNVLYEVDRTLYK